MKDAAPAPAPPPLPGWPRVFLLTARGREATCRATLAAWARTDWPGAGAPRVWVDPAPGGDPQQRIVTAWRGMLRCAVETAGDAPGLLLQHGKAVIVEISGGDV